jgi:hypothetical protein
MNDTELLRIIERKDLDLADKAGSCAPACG